MVSFAPHSEEIQSQSQCSSTENPIDVNPLSFSAGMFWHASEIGYHLYFTGMVVYLRCFDWIEGMAPHFSAEGQQALYTWLLVTIAHPW